MKYATFEGNWLEFRAYIREVFNYEEFEKLGFLIENSNLENTKVIIGTFEKTLLTRIAVDYRLASIEPVTYFSLNNYLVYGNLDIFPTSSKGNKEKRDVTIPL